MRVLIATQTYFPTTNGQAVFAANLAEGLARRGHEVVVVTPGDELHSYSEERNGVRVEYVAAVPIVRKKGDVRLTPFPQIQAPKILERFRPDIVHIQDHYPLCRSVVQAARKRGYPVIGTNHFLPENIMRNMPGPLRDSGYVERLLWWTMLDLFNELDFVTAPSQTAARILLEQGLEVPVKAISCGVDVRRFRPLLDIDRRGQRLHFGVDPDRVVIVYVGRVDHEKRLDVAVQAMYILNRPDVQLAIAGRGFHLPDLQTLVRTLGLQERVVFLGYVPPEEHPLLLNCADIFVMPSEAELLSIATLEAMACGLPVLAADARALPEIVHHGVNGYLFKAGDPEDAARWMARLLAERDRWPAMGQAARQTAEAHDIERVISEYEALYQEVIKTVKETAPM